GERFGRASGAKSDANVVEEAGDEAERGFGIDAVEYEGDRADDGEEGDDAEKREDGESVFVVDFVLANMEFADAVGAKDRFEAVLDDFVGDVGARSFDTASSGARHAADEHEDE